MTRPYRLNRRAKSQAETRQKIVEAAIELHKAHGPAATSMRDVAEKAKVGIVTVYRHFPDETALLGACSGTYFQRHPFPDPEDWRSTPDAYERLRRGLRDTYAYHRDTEPMIASVINEVRDQPVMEPYHAHWRHAVEVLLEPWPEAERLDESLRAALALALSFDTWQLLTRRQGLSDEKAIALMLRLSCDCPGAA